MVKLTSLLPLALSVSSAAGISLRKRDAASYLATERPEALQFLLANIGPDGAEATNASRGVVIAAPGVVNPDYRYSWTRDSAMTLKAVNEEFLTTTPSLQSTIENYIYAEANRQTIYNAMGPLYPWGTGLGEPKFQINLTRFNGVWGRPQRDGPALRAISMMEYITYLVNNGGTAHAKNVIWPIVSNDLNYVGEYWHEIGYDLWEEVAGLSFFTIQASYHALARGIQIAKMLGEECGGWQNQAVNAGCFLATNFWNATGQYLNADIDQPSGNKRSNINANPLIAANENFDIDGSCDNLYYQPCSSRVLATHKAYVDAFRKIYPINSGYGANAAIATGRYPEDTYYGGNPWYLCTFGAAELLYNAAAQFRHQGQLTIDSTSLPFFKGIYPAAKVGTYSASSSGGGGGGGGGWNNWGSGGNGGNGAWGGSGGGQSWGDPAQGVSGEFADILTAMRNYADGFITVVQKYTPSNGSLSEQYNRTTGEPLSAWALTWSFASALSVSQRRAGQFPPSWGSRNAAQLPSSCPASPPTDTFMGTYAAPTAAGAMAVSTACTVQVTFNVIAPTTFGQNVYLSGDYPSLGDWAPSYEPMVPDFYTSAQALWYSIVDLPPNSAIHYKYVHQNTANYTYEITNRTVNTPACGNGRVQIHTNDTFSGDGTVVTTDFCNPDVTHCW